MVLRTWSSGKQAAASAVVHPKPFVPPPSSLLAPSLSPLFVCPLSPPLPCLSSSLLLILSPGVAIPHEFAGANSAHSWGFAGLFTGQGREQEDGPRSTPGAQHRTQRHQSEMITAIVLEHSPCFVHGRTLSPPRCSITRKGIRLWQNGSGNSLSSWPGPLHIAPLPSFEAAESMRACQSSAQPKR